MLCCVGLICFCCFVLIVLVWCGVLRFVCDCFLVCEVLCFVVWFGGCCLCCGVVLS